jgi:hypothetical protein
VRDGRLNQWKRNAEIRWNIRVREPGQYTIRVEQRNWIGEQYVVKVNGREYKNPGLKTPDGFVDIALGEVQFDRRGDYVLTMQSSPDSKDWEGRLAIRQIRLVKNP